MTLPASGTISTTQIRTEIGGSGAVVIPSTETRTLTNKASGALILPTDFHGKSWATLLDTQTVTVGGTTYTWGYTGAGIGSVSDGTSNLYSGAQVWGLYGDLYNGQVAFALVGNRANSGWTKMVIDSNEFLRSAATYYTATDGEGQVYTYWTWGGNNPFGVTVGAQKQVKFY